MNLIPAEEGEMPFYSQREAALPEDSFPVPL
jgi:hypothetical protein